MNWWETIDFYETSGIAPVPIFVIRCETCEDEFETMRLDTVPSECPSCGARNTKEGGAE